MSGRRDVVDSLNDIFDGFDIRDKASEMKRRYNLADKDFMQLQDAYFMEERGSFEQGADGALKQMLEFLGVPPPKRRSSQDILEDAKRRQVR